MKKNIWFIISGISALIFVIFTLIVSFVDVQPTGLADSKIGLGSINLHLRDIFGQSKTWDLVTIVLGAISFAVIFALILVAVWQGYKRKSIKKIDKNLILLGLIYCLLLFLYIFFELVVINKRPILSDGELKASYPSSHTLLICTSLFTALVELPYLVKKKWIVWTCNGIGISMVVVGIVGRMLCGAHWFTDIIAGIILSFTLVFLYIALIKFQSESGKQKKIGETESSVN